MSVDLFGRPSFEDTGERNGFDYYPTPAWMTRSLLHYQPGISGRVVLEPCAGDGAISRVLAQVSCTVLENDIDPRHGHDWRYDATTGDLWQNIEVPWVITNPPFNVALAVLSRAYEHATVGVAFLLRKTFLEPTDDRGPWLSSHPPTRIIGLPRYSFRGTGSDSVSCDWMIWEKRPSSHGENLPPIVIDYVAERR